MGRKNGKAFFQFCARVKGIGASASIAGKRPSGADFSDASLPCSIKMSSPDGKIRAVIESRENLTYNVFLGNEQIIFDSHLGISVKGIDLGSGAIIGKAQSSFFSEEYADRGNDNLALDRRNTYIIPVHHKSTGCDYEIEVRLWDDCFGFRYVFDCGKRLLVTGESTSFQLPIDSFCFYQTDVVKLQGKTLKVETRYLPSNIDMACLATFELKDSKGYVMLTEANLNNYPGAALHSRGSGNITINLWDSGDFFTKHCVSPWRLVIACRTLNELTSCKAIKNASEPMKEMFTSADWIVPSKSAWSFFEDEPHCTEYSRILSYNQYAQEMDYKYSIIDAGWRKWGITEAGAFRKVGKIVEDARKRDVSIFLWKSVRRGPYFSIYRKWFMKKCVKAGVKGIKLDHIESETQFMINLYRKFLEEAAQHKLMVLYHNPQKPTGLSRTYPNLMSMEAIRGMQCHCDPDDTTILPFTRLVAGDADYTPLCFSVPARRGSATLGHILATCVIMTSSFMTISENPHTLKEQCFADFIRKLPTVWDETIALPQSEIGEKAVFARRNGNEWYLAVLNSLRCSREIEITLDFLADDLIYSAEIFRDDESDSLKVVRIERKITRNDSLTFKLLKGGGEVVKFTVSEKK